jgi:hypothetical protein
MVVGNTPLDPEAERFFFEVEVPELLGKIRRGTDKLGTPGVSGRQLTRARGEISRAAHALGRSLNWYRRTSVLGASTPAAPWLAGLLPKLLAARIREASLRIAQPSGRPGSRQLTVPGEALVEGLLGAASTLGAATGGTARMAFEPAEGLLFARIAARAKREALDPERLLRCYRWPGVPEASGCDAGLPFLATLLRLAGGELELIWRSGRWTLEASIPTVP